MFTAPSRVPVLCLNSGTHGDEPEGTLAILDIAAELDPEALSGTLIGIPVLNILAFTAKASLDVSGVRETPVDWKNLARIFPGRADGTVTERLAHTVVSEIVPRVDAVVDFHSGGTRGTSHWITGFVGAAGEAGRKSLALAELFPLKTLWRVSPWSKFSASCIEQGVQVAVIETTGPGPGRRRGCGRPEGRYPQRHALPGYDGRRDRRDSRGP